jgi:hypothetical protein
VGMKNQNVCGMDCEAERALVRAQPACRCDPARQNDGWDARMPMKYGLVVASILVLGLTADSADAVATNTLKAAAAQRTIVSRIASRHYSWRNGKKHGDFYEHDSSKLPLGTQRWREQMRRENRLGNPG